MIGPKRALKLERHLKEEIGMPHPLHYCNSYFRWHVESLAELTQEQGKELIARAEVVMPEVREQIKREKARDEARARERELNNDGRS